MSKLKDFTLSCPLPITDYPTVTLAHGGGGKLMHQLIERMILPAFNSPLLETRHDGAVFELGGARLAFTTDSYVVHPLFFPAAILARWRSTARSTIFPCAARARCT